MSRLTHFNDRSKTSDADRGRRRLVIVVRADPVICGHSGEARNLAEAAMQRGFTEVRILSWPLELLESSGLPLKPLEGVMPYSEGIEVERPGPVGDYKVVDGRYQAGMTGRLVELFTDGVPTVAMSLYLSPHTIAVSDAVRAAEATGLPVNVITIAEAVGSDVTNVVRSCVADGRYGAAAHVLAVVPGRRRPGRRVGVHPGADHLLGHRDRRGARDHLREPVHGPGGDLLPGDQHRRLPGSGPGATISRAQRRGWSRTATCSTCPGWPTPRGSTI